jgi:hypothetical protein
MKRVLVVFVMLAACSVLLAESIKWEMTNIYPKTSSELHAWTNGVETVTALSPYEDLLETKRRVDILWTEYTNRMERIAKMQEKRKAAEEKRKAAEYRNEVRRKYRRK